MSEKFEDAEIYPVEKSASGENAYYLENCEVVGHRPAYCACLRKVEDRKKGRLATAHSDCSAAIGKKQCAAQRMKKEELVKGQAIYFISRKKLAAFCQSEEAAERQKFVATSFGKDKRPKRQAIERAVPPKHPERKHFLDASTGDYADALNKAMSASAAKPASPSSQDSVEQQKNVPAVQLRPGMSLLELARLQLQAQVV